MDSAANAVTLLGHYKHIRLTNRARVSNNRHQFAFWWTSMVVTVVGTILSVSH